ncbi:MAG: 4Fe-4S dicluster domain-containing protein [Candidatus Marinimicrobia bacterium]|nr:4Fe-4S dicluster domain-containing protein [Candidatus Neomarinimicrobiota bacterium]
MGKANGHVVIREDECKGCELCVVACPFDLLSISDRMNQMGYHPAEYIGKDCTGCGICFYTCPEPGAITVFKKWNELTETKYCENCKKEQKVFTASYDEKVLLCSSCLKEVR